VALALLSLAFASFLACGRKTLPLPPEMVAPEVVEGLEARNAQGGILLSWKRPTHYADGQRMLDLAGFQIERSVGDGKFEFRTTLTVTDQARFRQIRNFRYLDSAVTDGETYRYRIVSFTLDRYFSPPSPAVEIVRRAPAMSGR